ncbi:MAG: hypothetical protein ACOYLU_11370 [Limisphaerales bacterium]
MKRLRTICPSLLLGLLASTTLLLSAASSLLASELLTGSPDISATIRVNAYYYADQRVANTNRVVERSGFVTTAEYPRDRRLFDTRRTGEGSVATHFWSNQAKRVEIDVDLGGECRLDRVVLSSVNGKESGSSADGCELYLSSGGFEQDQLSKAAEVTNPHASEAMQGAYDFIFEPAEACGRYVRVVASSQVSAMMVLSELQIEGTRVEPKALRLPEGWRLELEDIEGAVEADGLGLIGKGIYVGHDRCAVTINETSDRSTSVWVRHFDNGGRSLKASLNSQDVVIDEPSGLWKWAKIGTVNGPVFDVRLNRNGAEPPMADSLLFTTEAGFDPNKAGLETVKALPKKAPTARFAEALRAREPDIEPARFVQEVLNHYQLKSDRSPAFTSAEGAILWNGKPVFPMTFFHVGPEDPRPRHLPLNCFMTSERKRSESDPRVYGSITTLHAKWFAYDSVVDEMRTNVNDSNVMMHYICDEPENVGVTAADLAILNALVKAVDPLHPTFVNVSPNMAGNAAVTRTADVVGVDHYPIPGGRIADVGLSVDAARSSSGGKPVIFIAQTFDWAAYGRDNGRWPTPDEIAAMVWIPVIHGCRGIWFYEFPAPRMDSKTFIKDVNPAAWDRIAALLGVLHEMEPALTGPETEFPAAVKVTAQANHPPEWRLAINREKTEAFLIVANPWETPSGMTIEWKLQDVSLEPVCTDGAKANGNQVDLLPMGTGVYRVKASNLASVKTLSHEEALAAVKLRKMADSSPPETVAPFSEKADWSKAADLLDTWKSSTRLDEARVLSTPEGLRIRVVQRFKKDAKSKTSDRDGEVGNDPSITLFLGAPSSRKYAQLVVNTLNTQADSLVDLDAKDRINGKVDYSWNSQVKQALELAEYEILIPWDSLQEMTGVKGPAQILFNLGSSHSAADWAGLSGGGYHNPDRFGILTIEYE